ncbi:hypothetical protein K501DRAFT_280420 [Backusella circina FSU 941]|nr:hypothetical protein K501DRAFT_280420 [Backusella circina FSU 941]
MGGILAIRQFFQVIEGDESDQDLRCLFIIHFAKIPCKMKQKIIAFDIIIPDKIVFHGLTAKEKKIKGKVRVATTQPVKTSKIELEFKGQINLDWKKTNGLFSERMSASKTLKKFTKTLLESDILPGGLTYLDFEFSIPSYICPSFQSKFCQITYSVSANLMMPSKLQKNKSVNKIIHVNKTLVPKSMATTPDFRVPQLEMVGKRSGVLSWSFQIPQWVCLGDSIEFDGVFHCFSPCVKINRIYLDVIQEEIYFYDSSCTDFKRRLVTNTNPPSTYVNPPFDTPIRFSFPLACLKKESNMMEKKKNQEIQKDNFNHALESPFLTICHFARLLIYLQNGLSICIGAPFKVTPRLKPVYDSDLPSYSTALKEGRKLPSYSTAVNNGCSSLHTISIQAEDTENHRQQQRCINNQQQMNGVDCTDIITIGERNFIEFCAI